jgi:hypothetical protein
LRYGRSCRGETACGIFGTDATTRQGLKLAAARYPSLFSIVYGPTKEAAEKSRRSGLNGRAEAPPLKRAAKVECEVAAEEFSRKDYFRCRAAIASSALGELDFR